ncbi:NUDIX domain-containing protein [Streptomyces albipurpureus]|uniref:NUDIX hydrolase n=1 Tax=Streptomyces albipurpureus TaxID=2897419 RepID=A0ABT0V2A8_9ACTN|nr:NUDIX hydrolase [Streptomyces sp. CWNU-1]MCM2393521.1 NUDIX hydrolase [Streptomyces sp. CWNU-1]
MTTPRPGDPGWMDYLAEGNARQARKRTCADAVIRDADGRVLLVEPSYKNGWDLPGGMAEANEPPVDALRRELREELALDLPVRRLLCLDWVAPHEPWDDLIAFVFDAGTLTAGQAAAVRPRDEELKACAFFSPAKAFPLLPRAQRRRLERALAALDSGQTAYLHNGIPPW